MTASELDRELRELGVDLELRELWQVLEPLVLEAEAGGQAIGVPQLACAMRAAYGRGFNAAIAWVEGKSSVGVERRAGEQR